MNFWKWSGESRYPGALPLLLENFRRAFPLDPTDCPCVSEDGAIALGSKSPLINPGPSLARWPELRPEFGPSMGKAGNQASATWLLGNSLLHPAVRVIKLS